MSFMRSSGAAIRRERKRRPCGAGSAPRPRSFEPTDRGLQRRLGLPLLRRRVRAAGFARERRLVRPRHPVRRTRRALLAVTQHCDQVLKYVDPIELCGMDEAHENIADMGTVDSFIKEAVFSV